MKTSLPKTETALRSAHKTLPNSREIVDLGYLLDVDQYGKECLLVYITMRAQSALDFPAKRVIETRLRDAVSKATGLDVYFRWQTDVEVAEEVPLLTMNGLLDIPLSVLKA